MAWSNACNAVNGFVDQWSNDNYIYLCMYVFFNFPRTRINKQTNKQTNFDFVISNFVMYLKPCHNNENMCI